jgi:hypothetical protein
MSEAMKKELQEGFEKALASFEIRQEAEHQRFREREKFEIEWARIRTVVVVPALEEIKALWSKAGWQCEVRADKDQGVHFTIYRGNVKGERPYMTFQPEKSKDLCSDQRVWLTAGQLYRRPNFPRFCANRSAGRICQRLFGALWMPSRCSHLHHDPWFSEPKPLCMCNGVPFAFGSR